MGIDDFSKNNLYDLQEYIVGIKDYPKLTINEFDSLLEDPTIENKNKFIECYLRRVVVYAVTLYRKLTEYFDIPYSIIDFIQEGNEALVKLVYSENYRDFNLFNLTFYTKFRRNVIKHLLPISPNIVDRYIKFIEMKNDYSQSEEYDISFENFGRFCDLSIVQTMFLKNCYAQNQPVSFDIGNGEKLVDGNSNVEEIVDYLMLKDLIIETIKNSKLTDKEISVLIKHLGFNTDSYDGDNFTRSFVELAKDLNVSYQRIDQLYRQAIGKIKRNTEAVKKLYLFK